MRYRRLGDSGLVVSVVGLGCNNFGWRLEADATARVVGAAVDAGITLFDTADVYGGQGRRGASEELLGRALGRRRGEVVVATKFGKPMEGVAGPDRDDRGSRRYVRRAVEGSLRRLGTDWIDLYQMHEPDPATPIEETLSVLDDLVREGKVRYVGSSNFAGWQIADADWTAVTTGFTRFVSAQNHYNLLERSAEAEVVPACERFGVGLLPYYPLASGLLTGKYRRERAAPTGTRLTDRRDVLARAPWDVLEALEGLAREHGATLLDLAIGGLAAQPAVASVIAGATTPEQVAANVRAGEWEPDGAALAALDEITG